MNYIKSLIIFLFWGVYIYCSALSYGVSAFPVFNHYDIKPVVNDQYDNSIPWSNGIKLGIQLYHFEREITCFYSSLSYNSSTLHPALAPETNTPHYQLSPGTVHNLKYSFNFSYNVQLSKRIYLNPEIGLGIQSPFILIDSNSENDQDYIATFDQMPTPTIGADFNLWLKYPLKNKHIVKLGFCSYLPFYRTVLGSYTVANHSETVETGLGYTGLGLTYIFKTHK